MSAENVVKQIREALNGHPGQPIVLGVCRTLAERFDQEPWIFRLAAILMMLFFTFPALAAYIVLGFSMRETEQRTRGFFQGLAAIARETIDKLAQTLRDIFDGGGSRSKGY